MILGDLGAEILKVEKPGEGDDTRRWGPPFLGTESAYFFCVNRNKKSLTIDIKNPAGVQLIKELATKSDVFVENYVPGKLQKMGLGYSQLKEVAPHLVYCSISGYGSDGPYATRAGYDVIAAAVGGLLHITGPEGGEPCKVGVAMTDLSTGLYAHGAIMAALLQRHRTGEGQHIDCNLLSTQVSCLANLASNYLNGGPEARRWGTAHESIVPYQAFQTKDGYFVVGAGNDKQFKILCQRLKLEHIADDPQYARNEDRVINRSSLLKALQTKFREQSTAHWLKVFDESGIPYGPINNMQQVFSDPQVLHNEMIVEMEHSTAGKIRLPGPAVKYSDSQNRARLPPPCLGQHTSEVLHQVLGYSTAEVENLQKTRAI
ncbi:PREDICTED: succinate--hydroxymethylglutarate CoA-transferase-like [Priapulus caudatus]|uniref:Succinate--hydroxymethylglutarate CoA-transferase-like n=1 Tax=Priapulus caudatus TaxID=37621 RepID=A0ABM1DZV2_PRICU|nr:PREDICTED: succinate--hydroxymethylglutarate CoA-transferase-like [Priapulus caudatus]